ncbi:THUMP domain-containing protein 2 isoform X2 [Antennarius striatus]|uniref:THUMP domain-containing protein 2 isoform X2 n=1 Tax=Antennarius striatus TaxID=241820 RepID=UPI0035B34AB6
MTEPVGEGSLVRYFCTAGNGMERFLMDEVKKKLAAEDVCQMSGKVLFSSRADISRISELKAAERLFLLLKVDSPVNLPSHSAASVLRSRLLGDCKQWTSAVMTWKRLQGEMEDRKTKGVTTKGGEEKGRSEAERMCRVQSGNCTGGQREASGCQRNVRERLGEKRKRDDEEEQEGRGSAVHDSTNEKHEEKEITHEEQWRRGEEENGMVTKFCRSQKNVKLEKLVNTDNDRKTPVQDQNVEDNRRMSGVVEDVALERVVNEKTTGGNDKNLLRHSWIVQEPPSIPVSFRICCKCTGSLSRHFSSQEVSKVIGVGVSRRLGWRSDLKNPHLEVNVYLSDDLCLLGIPLTRSPLANRCYIKTTGLRSTVAWAMSSLVQIQPGSCVVDPMCGVGTILIEAAQEHQAACFLGVDIDDGQLQKANENVEFAELGNRVHLLKASSMALPLPSASVDAVISDLPFGRKFGTTADMAANLPLILTEMERVLSVGGTMVLLLSPTLSCQLKKLTMQKDATSCNQETNPQTGTPVCTSSSLSSTRQQTIQVHQRINSPPTQNPHHQAGKQHNQPPVFSSLKHEATLRVSLGLIDGLIHKYVKMDT